MAGEEDEKEEKNHFLHLFFEIQNCIVVLKENAPHLKCRIIHGQ